MENKQKIELSSEEKLKILEEILDSLKKDLSEVYNLQTLSGQVEGDIYFGKYTRRNHVEVYYGCGLLSEYVEVPHSILHSGWQRFGRVGLFWDNYQCVFDIDKVGVSPKYELIKEIVGLMKENYSSTTSSGKNLLFDKNEE